MKRWLILLITFMILFGSAVPALANIMDNSGFERGNTDSWYSSGTTVFTVSDKYTQDGDLSGLSYSTTSGIYYYVYQEYSVVAIDESVDFSVYVMRTSTEDTAYAFIQWFDGDDKFIIDKYSDPATHIDIFDYLTVSHDSPTGAATIRVGAAISTTTTNGNANYIDSASLGGAAVPEFNKLLLLLIVLPEIMIVVQITQNRRKVSKQSR